MFTHVVCAETGRKCFTIGPMTEKSAEEAVFTFSQDYPNVEFWHEKLVRLDEFNKLMKDSND